MKRPPLEEIHTRLGNHYEDEKIAGNWTGRMYADMRDILAYARHLEEELNTGGQVLYETEQTVAHLEEENKRLRGEVRDAECESRPDGMSWEEATS